MSNPRLSRLQPCPCCGGGSLIFVSCRSCGAILGWCGEEDHAVGVYDGTDLRGIGLGKTRSWAREGCPMCKGEDMEHSSAEDVERLGFAADEIMRL
jgi:hypothetical protein